MNDLARPILESDIQALETTLCGMPQADCPVTHHFGPGVYIREVRLPAGACVIGHSHRHAHLNIMLAGRLTMIGLDGSRREVSAPATFTGKAGRKIAVIHEDVIFQNVYATDETDVEKLEEQLFDKSAAFLEAQSQLLLAVDHTADEADYLDAIASHGFSQDQVKAIVENEDDQIPMPLGAYKVQVGPSLIHGKGMFATGDFVQGDIIAPARIDGKRTPAGRFINHAKDPNAAMVLTENSNVVCVALRDISGCKGGNLGEEITIDYRRALSLGVK